MTYDANNVFAKIIRKEIQCDIVYEDEDSIAFHDIQKAAPIHILLIPKQPFCSYDEFVQVASPDLIVNFFKTAQAIAQQHGIAETGYRLVTNCGMDAMQTIHHFHLHILGGAVLGGFTTVDKTHLTLRL